jgi:hypothetical protein
MSENASLENDPIQSLPLHHPSLRLAPVRLNADDANLRSALRFWTLFILFLGLVFLASIFSRALPTQLPRPC